MHFLGRLLIQLSLCRPVYKLLQHIHKKQDQGNYCYTKSYMWQLHIIWVSSDVDAVSISKSSSIKICLKALIYYVISQERWPKTTAYTMKLCRSLHNQWCHTNEFFYFPCYTAFKHWLNVVNNAGLILTCLWQPVYFIIILKVAKQP